MDSLEIVLEKSGTSYTQEEKEALAERKNTYYRELLKTFDDSAILPGARESLCSLRKDGIRLSVGSSSKNTPEILEKTGLLDMVDELSCG